MLQILQCITKIKNNVPKYRKKYMYYIEKLCRKCEYYQKTAGECPENKMADAIV